MGFPTQKSVSRLVVILAILLGLSCLLGPTRVHGQSPSPYKVWLPIIQAVPARSNPVQTGVATYYAATGDGACMFGASPDDLNVAAMNQPEWQNSGVCGETVHVTGPKGAIDVRIVDLCPGCQAGQLDLSAQAFAQIAEPIQGRVPISWQLISPNISSPIAYHFKDGSNQWWTAVQVRNIRNPVSKLEYQASGGAWVSVPRTSYNYFVQTNPGMGVGPYSFRVTDLYGNVLVDHGIPFSVDATVNGASQFPPGP